MKILAAILLLVVIVESRHPFHDDRSYDVEELEDYLNAVRREEHLRDAFKHKKRHHFKDFEEDEDDEDEEDGDDEGENDLEEFESTGHKSKKDHTSGHSGNETSPTSATSPATSPTTPPTSPTTSPTTTTGTTPVTTTTKSKLHELLKHFAESIRSLKYNQSVNRKTMLSMFKELVRLRKKVSRLERKGPNNIIHQILRALRGGGEGNRGNRGGMGGGNPYEGGESRPFGGDLEYAGMFLKDEEKEDEKPRRHHRFH